MLDVRSCQPRLGLAAVALGGALLAGRPNCLGLALLPLHDRLTAARLSICPAPASAAAPGPHPHPNPHHAGAGGLKGAPMGAAASVRLEVPGGCPATLVPLAAAGAAGGAGEAAVLRTVAHSGRAGDAALPVRGVTMSKWAACLGRYARRPFDCTV